MRHPSAPFRALSHPSGHSVRSRVAIPSHPPAAGQVTRPAVDRIEPGGPAPAGATGTARDAPPGLATVSLPAALLAAVGAVALLTDSTAFHGFVLTSAPLAAVGVLLWRPGTVDQTLAALVSVLLLPALLAIALAVRLSGPGPVLVRQESTHSDNRSRPPLRFRTTTSAAVPNGPCSPVGRLLRDLSLDKLPGLFDVVRGDAPLSRAGCP